MTADGRARTVDDRAVVIWHNPRCSKSCETLALIEARGIAPQIVPYLDAPPSSAALRDAASRLGVPLRALIRTKEDAYLALGLDDPSLSEAAIADILSANPVLIERPIVFARGRAAIGRPPQAALSIL